MKKIILALLISGAVILSGCGSSSENGDGEGTQTSQEQLVYCPLLQTIQLFAMPPTAAMQDEVLRGLYERLRGRPCRYGFAAAPQSGAFQNCNGNFEIAHSITTQYEV